ncbi:MAG: DUF4142 domain-containing protein [Bacteroidota bacterium]|nr:DUF4142 domain-containing protein [Bacteroidota bacterium]
MKNLFKNSAIIGAGLMSCLFLSFDSFAQTNTKKDAKEVNEDKFKNTKDADLLVEAYSSGMMEIRVAENVKGRTVSPELKELANRLEAEHNDLNNQILELAEKMSITLPAQLTEGQLKDVDNIAKKSGMDLDKAYIDMLVASHKKLEMLFEKGAKCEDSEISALFAAGLPRIKEHLEMAMNIKNSQKEDLDKSGMN